MLETLKERKAGTQAIIILQRFINIEEPYEQAAKN